MSGRAIQWVPIGLLLILVVLTLWLNRLVQSNPGRNNGQERHDPDVIIESFSAQKFSQTGEVHYTLSAKKMTHYPDNDSALLESIQFSATPPSQQRFSAEAKQGVLFDGGDRVVIEGDVTVRSEGDANTNTPALTLKTPRLTILPNENIARSDAGVSVEGAGSRMTADSFVLNNETRTLNFKRVSGVLERNRK